MSALYCCGVIISDEKEFDSHLLTHFLFKRKRPDFFCLVKNCNFNITDRYHVKRHYVRHHKDLIINIFDKKTIDSFSKKGSDNAFELNDSNDDDDDDDVDFNLNDNMDIDDVETNYDSDDSISTLLNQNMESFTSIPAQNELAPFNFEKELLNLISDKRKSIDQKNLADLFLKYNNLLLKTSDSNSIDKAVIERVNSLFKSSYQIEKFLLRNVSGTSDLSIYQIKNTSQVQSSLVQKPLGNFYHFSILPAIDKFLSNERLRNLLLSEHNRDPDPNVLRTFKDAKLFSLKDHDKNIINLELQLFIDDVQFPIRGNYSLVFVAGTFSNLPIKYHAKKTDMFCLLIVSRIHLKNMKIDDLFVPLFDELDYINSHNLKLGEKFGIQNVFKIELSSVTGDNKAIHELLRLPGSFMSDSCRDCHVKYKRLNDKKSPFLTEFMVRPLKKEQVFDNRLFTCFNFPRDFFHDLAEGVCQKVLTPILKHYYKNSIEILLNKVDQFKIWRYGKIEGIKTDYSVKGTGMKVLDFFLIFPFLDKKIVRSSDHFKLLTLLREIILLIICDTVAKNELDDFHEKVKQFQKLYFNLFTITEPTIETFTMKIHYLIHYKDSIEYCGPSINNAALKGERFLKSQKDFFKTSNCHKNISFSAATNYQKFSEPKLFTSSDSWTTLREISKEDIHNSIAPEYLKFIDSNLNLEELKELDLDNIKFKKGYTFILGYESSGNPFFIEIEKLFKQGHFFKIIGSVFRTKEYDSYDFTYKIENLNTLETLDVDNLAWHKNLYHFKEFNFIIKDFHSKANYHINQNFIFQNHRN